jgi:hypothetical protein
MSPSELWRFFPLGYLLTVLVETPILFLGLSRHHSSKKKLLAGFWLTACTYPIVVLVLPLLFVNSSRTTFLIVAEIFAPAAECLLFWVGFERASTTGLNVVRDFGIIVLANLASFAVGEVMNHNGWFGLLA